MKRWQIVTIVYIKKLYNEKIYIQILRFYTWYKRKILCILVENQFVQYGDYVGAARVPRISRMAKVKVGSHASFNGFTVSGGGG